MLAIKPIEDKSVQEELVRDCGGTYNPRDFAYILNECTDDGETVLRTLGACQFGMKDGRGILSLLRTLPGIEDEEALMIAARAAAHFLFRCEIRHVTFAPDAADEALMRKLGFAPNADGLMEMDLLKYYTTPCHER